MIEQLHMSNNPHVVGDCLARIVANLSVTSLWIEGCQITADELRQFADELEGIGVKVGFQNLDIFIAILFF